MWIVANTLIIEFILLLFDYSQCAVWTNA